MLKMSKIPGGHEITILGWFQSLWWPLGGLAVLCAWSKIVDFVEGFRILVARPL